MESRNNTNKKADRYDNAIITLAKENPQLDLVQLSTVFENLGGRVEGQTPNLVRIMDIEWIRSLLRNNRNDEAEKDKNEGENIIITLNQLENFFQNGLEGNIEIFEELMNIPATKGLFGDNYTNSPLIQLSDLGNFFRNNLNGEVELFKRIMTDDITHFVINHEAPSSAISELGNFFQNKLNSNIEIFEELIQNQAIQILLGFNEEIPSIELTDLGNFFQESLEGNIEIFRRIMTDDIMRLLTDDLDNPIIALADLGNFFCNSLGGNIEAFETVINTPGITGLLRVNPDNLVQITITELGNYCQQGIRNNILEQALNNLQMAEDPVQQILGEIGILIVNQEDQPMDAGNNSEDDVMLE